MSETGYTATYSPDDNKLRMYADGRLPDELYQRVRAAGFRWAPRQELFVAPMWTPSREDLLIELCGEIGDEDTSLAERAEERAERFDDLSDKRAADADSARAAVDRIADGIPMGQPILVGHHSEKRARKDAEKIERGMGRAVRMWQTSKYWTDRAAGALRHAKYKERPDVRARRIKKLEADRRREIKRKTNAETATKLWNCAGLDYEKARHIANFDHVSRCYPLADYPRDEPASQYEGDMCLWSALEGIISPEQAREIALKAHAGMIEWCSRWIGHIDNRLAYERAMLGESGGTVADRTKPEKGGACRCWCSPAHGRGWSTIQKVNKVSVSLLDNWGNDGPDFRRLIRFDELKAVMSKAEVDAARGAGRLIEETPRGFGLRSAAPTDPAPPPKPTEPKDGRTEQFEAMRDTLRDGGVKAVSAPQLFQTPRELAEQMIELADIEPGHRVLEPSAGTGNLIGAMGGRMFAPSLEHNGQGLLISSSTAGRSMGEIVAVEINLALADHLRAAYPLTAVQCCDFLDQHPGPQPTATDLHVGRLGWGFFDRVVMNPPFAKGQDIAHVRHAYDFLKPGGRLVAIMSEGPFFRSDRKARKFREWLDERDSVSEQLPADTFKVSGTGVHTRLVVIEKD